MGLLCLISSVIAKCLSFRLLYLEQVVANLSFVDSDCKSCPEIQDSLSLDQIFQRTV